MLVTDIRDEMCYWQILYVGDGSGYLGHENQLSFYISVGRHHSKMSPTSKFNHQHPQIVTNLSRQHHCQRKCVSNILTSFSRSIKSIFNLDNSSFKKLTKQFGILKRLFRSIFPWWIHHKSFQLETRQSLYVLLLLYSLSFKGFTTMKSVFWVLKGKNVQPFPKIFATNFYATTVFSSQLAMELVSFFLDLIHSQM